MVNPIFSEMVIVTAVKGKITEVERHISKFPNVLLRKRRLWVHLESQLVDL
jgi:hypothetical protein